ncbi:MAG TPA: outer membrane beta-barrel protein [Gammaproteobacteria bacterium]
MNKFFVMLALAFLGASFAGASDLSYTNVAIGYQQGEIGDQDHSGIGVFGNFAVNDSLFVLAGYSALESDDEVNTGFGSGTIDRTALNLGLGFHAPIADKADFVTSVAYSDQEAEFAGMTSDGNGYVLSAGVRALPTGKVELNAFVNYADIEDESDTAVAASARYAASPAVSFGLTFSSADDADIVTLDGQYAF